MQAFSLDRASGIPVKLQFQAQVRYQIATGLLYPGDQLPPLRDLAAGLGINLNTVIRAIDDLVSEGYLYSHQGRGVFVADEPPAGAPGAALRSLLAGVLGPAREWGLEPEAMAMALLAQSQLARAAQPASGRLLLTGSSRADLRPLQRELEGALPGITVVPSLPEEVARPGAFRVVAATLLHAGPGQIPLAAAADRQALAHVLTLPPGTPVALAAGDRVQAARLQQSLERPDGPAALSGPSPSRLSFRPVVDAAELPAALASAGALLAAPSGRPLAQQARAMRPDLPIVIEPLGLPPEAVAAIRQGLGTAAPEQRVGVRSSWV